MSPTARTFVALGWIGFAVLPWHLPDNASWYDWIFGYSADGSRAALRLVLAGRAWWLAPMALALLLATWPRIRRQQRAQASRVLVIAGLAGLAFLILQGFAIGLRGWTLPVLTHLFGEGPSQAGMG